MTDTIRFPDSTPHTVGEVRATHALRPTRDPLVYEGDNGVCAELREAGHHRDHKLHLMIGFPPLNDRYGWFLQWDDEKQRYAVGAWPNCVLTAFLVRLIPGGMLLEVRDAEKCPEKVE